MKLRDVSPDRVAEWSQRNEQTLASSTAQVAVIALNRMLRFALRRGWMGVVLFRLHGSGPDADNARAIAALTSRDDWAEHFAVVTDDRVRLRPLPRRR